MLIYILFLVMFSLPLLVMEFSVGRASRKGIARSFDVMSLLVTGKGRALVRHYVNAFGEGSLC